MRTHFSPEQLDIPAIARCERQFRSCVHCGICTATCPTYKLLGDELDGPRGRIQLIQSMLEQNATPSSTVVKHLDRCLSCLACSSACPSGVDYAELIGQARAHIEENFRRPWMDRFIRAALGWLMPRRHWFAASVRMAKLFAPLGLLGPRRLRPLFEFARSLPLKKARAPACQSITTAPAVLLHKGCVQEAVAPEITQSAINVLQRLGFAVRFVEGEGCCGALNHHLGQTEAFERRANALAAEICAANQDAPATFISTASGCGALMQHNAHYKVALQKAPNETALKVADVVSFLAEHAARLVQMRSTQIATVRVAYHEACTLAHGQKGAGRAVTLLRQLGFEVVEPANKECCGSAGVYNVLEPVISQQLRDAKAESLNTLAAQYIASGNVGCSVQLATKAHARIVHTVELIDWATGGKAPTPSS